MNLLIIKKQDGTNDVLEHNSNTEDTLMNINEDVTIELLTIAI